MRSLLLVFVLLLAAASAHAQIEPRPVITGRVVGERGGPLPGATVTLRSTQRALVTGTTTDAAGRYRLVAPAPGRYRLAASFVGYAAVEVDAELGAGETMRDFRLEPASVSADEVVVEGRGRSEAGVAPVTVSNVTARELDAGPAMKDLPVMLAAQPSVTFYSENGNGIGYTTLRLRGFDERRVAVSINGLPQNDPEDHAVYWINFFDLQGAITDVQVQRGAGTAFYGSTAVGGAINIVADPYRPDAYAALETGYGAYRTRRVTAEVNSGLLGGRYVAFARASRIASDGYRRHAWVEMTRFFAGVTRFGARTRLTVQAFGGPQRDALAYYGIPKAANERPIDDGAGGTVDRRSNYGEVSGDVERFHQPQVEVRHEWEAGPGVRVEGTAFYTSGDGFFDFDGAFRSADYLRLPAGFGGLSAEDRARPLYESVPGAAVTFRAYVDNDRAGYLPRVTVERGRNRYTAGADVLVHRSLHWGRVERASGLPASVVGASADARVYEYRGGKESVTAYGSALVRPSDAVAIQADLSVRRLAYRLFDEAFTGTRFAVPYTFVNPRVGVTLFPERAARFYASAAYAEREPRLKNLYDADEAGAGARPLFAPRADGSPDFDRPLVRPERGISVEAGAAITGRVARAGVTAYGLFFRDEIVASGGLDVFGVPRTGNAARTRHAGLELEAAARLLPGLTAEANVTASDDRFVRFTEFGADEAGAATASVRDGRRIALFPASSGSATLRYERRALGARLDAHFAGRTPITNAGTRDRALTVDPYVLANASVSYTRTLRRVTLRAHLDVNNLLDARVLQSGNAGGFFPAAERHAYAGLSVTVR